MAHRVKVGEYVESHRPSAVTTAYEEYWQKLSNTQIGNFDDAKCGNSQVLWRCDQGSTIGRRDRIRWFVSVCYVLAN